MQSSEPLNGDYAINILKNKYPDRTAWIVGKGPSLQFLQAKHFGGGPVIAMGHSILVVQELILDPPIFPGVVPSNCPIYSLQKDGCDERHHPHDVCAPNTTAGINYPAMVYPKWSIPLIMQWSYGRFCLTKAFKRIMISEQGMKDLGLKKVTTMSISMATSIAQYMGCTHLVYLCCDALVNGDIRTYNVFTHKPEQTRSGDHYKNARIMLRNIIGCTPYEFILPKEEDYG
jgi:hypothetical protein